MTEQNNFSAVDKLVLAMRFMGLPKEALAVGYLVSKEQARFDETYGLPYAELCKRSRLDD